MSFKNDAQRKAVMAALRKRKAMTGPPRMYNRIQHMLGGKGENVLMPAINPWTGKPDPARRKKVSTAHEVYKKQLLQHRANLERAVREGRGYIYPFHTPEKAAKRLKHVNDEIRRGGPLVYG
jgi:hypothetical protein